MTKKSAFLKLAALCACAVVTFSTTASAIELKCEPPVVLLGNKDTGPHPVTSIYIQNAGDTWAVVYHFADGSTVNRADQYNIAALKKDDLASIMTPGAVERGAMAGWTGQHRRHANLSMIAVINPAVGGGYAYNEWVFDSNSKNTTMQEVASCTPIDVASISPVPVPAPPSAPQPPVAAPPPVDPTNRRDAAITKTLSTGEANDIALFWFADHKCGMNTDNQQSIWTENHGGKAAVLSAIRRQQALIDSAIEDAMKRYGAYNMYGPWCNVVSNNIVGRY